MRIREIDLSQKDGSRLIAHRNPRSIIVVLLLA